MPGALLLLRCSQLAVLPCSKRVDDPRSVRAAAVTSARSPACRTPCWRERPSTLPRCRRFVFVSGRPCPARLACTAGHALHDACVTRGLPQARTKQPARPGKVPLEKGYSQMDWLRLTRTHPDLAGTRREDSDPVCLPCSSCRPGTSPCDSVLLLGANAAQPGACLAARRCSGCCAGGQAWGAGRCGGTSRWRRSRGTTRRRTRGLRCAARCGAARRGPDPMTGPGELSSSVYYSCESCERRCAATQCS